MLSVDHMIEGGYAAAVSGTASPAGIVRPVIVWRIAARARERRERTVPIGMSKIRAASL
jgi:hypothetical protein